MARTSVIDSATSQFFINLKDNDFLDHRGSFPGAFGYAVFGKVVEGMDVVDAIGSTPVERKNAQFQNLPKEPVIIRSIKKVGK
jgi:peptidyl-prolyl cis-trans isomerase A (cyclophilin A)